MPENEQNTQQTPQFNGTDFDRLFSMLYSQRMADPMSASVRDAAERQRSQYMANKNDWDRMLASGQDLPNINKPISFDKNEQAQINQQWEDKWNKPLLIKTGTDANGKDTFQIINIRPLGSYVNGEQFNLTPDYYSQVRRLYEQHGPGILNYIFNGYR